MLAQVGRKLGETSRRGRSGLQRHAKRKQTTDASPKIYEKESHGVKIPGRAIYMDMQATTPVDPRVLDSMLPHYTQQFGNPHSRTHFYGWENEDAVEDAREKLASLIRAESKEVVFTSGATESNNIAIKGVAKFYGDKKKHIITTQLEHKCVLNSCRYLEKEGYEVTYLPVKQNGILDLNVLEDCLASHKDTTALVSVMAVNNEIGVIQPLKEIGQLCRKHKSLFHTDAAQAVGKIPLNVNEMNIDLLSISGHKMYGPKGVGALYVRRRPRVRLESIISGGDQERGIRSGTVPVPLAVGLGKAAEICSLEMENDARHIKRLYEKLHKGITQRVPEVYLNGDPLLRYFGNLNLSFAFVEGESLLMGLSEVACSSGSACTSASLEPSYVLRALGVEDELAHTSIRFGIGRFTTDAEVDYTIDLVCRNVERLRELSPLYEMFQEGIDLKSIQWSQEH